MSNQFADNQAEFFNTYAKTVGTLDLDVAQVEIKNELETLLEVIPDIKNKRILDLGCGTGRLSLVLSQHAKEVVGLDISKDSIAVANNTAKKYHIKNFTGVVGDFNSITYKNHFDYVICLNLIHHVNTLDSILQNAKTSLKTNGFFVIFEFNPLNPLFIPFLYSIGQLKIHMNKEYIRSNIFTLQNHLKKNGFKNIRVYRHAFLPTTLYTYSSVFKKINAFLNAVPIINLFTAYHLFVCSQEQANTK